MEGGAYYKLIKNTYLLFFRTTSGVQNFMSKSTMVPSFNTNTLSHPATLRTVKLKDGKQDLIEFYR